jgi:Formyl transferase
VPFANGHPAVVILVVEDETLIRCYIADILRAAGYRVLESASGEEAIAMCASEMPGSSQDRIAAKVASGAACAASGPMRFSSLPRGERFIETYLVRNYSVFDARQKSSEASRQKWILPPKGPPMFTAERYRAKVLEHAKLAGTASDRDESRDRERFERGCIEFAGTEQRAAETSDQTARAKDHVAGPSKAGGRSTMRRRTNGLRKPEIIVAGVFANKILSTIDKRFAVRVVGDGFIDFDTVDFANVRLAIIFGYGHKIAERHLDKADFINIHGSLLPFGRGPHPHIWGWINGEPHGVTIHKMSSEIDKGPIIVQRKVELEPWENSINSTMYALVDAATELFQQNWNDLSEGSFALESTDPLSGSSHRLKDTQPIRDVVDRFDDAPIPIFLREVGARMAVSLARQPGRGPNRTFDVGAALPAPRTGGPLVKSSLGT